MVLSLPLYWSWRNQIDWYRTYFRLQTMQKMQAAAGGKGRGANGAPTPAQIQAMQVRTGSR